MRRGAFAGLAAGGVDWWWGWLVVCVLRGAGVRPPEGVAGACGWRRVGGTGGRSAVQGAGAREGCVAHCCGCRCSCVSTRATTFSPRRHTDAVHPRVLFLTHLPRRLLQGLQQGAGPPVPLPPLLRGAPPPDAAGAGGGAGGRGGAGGGGHAAAAAAPGGRGSRRAAGRAGGASGREPAAAAAGAGSGGSVDPSSSSWACCSCSRASTSSSSIGGRGARAHAGVAMLIQILATLQCTASCCLHA